MNTAQQVQHQAWVKFQSEALQYLLLMWLALIIMILVFGVAVGYFLKQKDSRG